MSGIGPKAEAHEHPFYWVLTLISECYQIPRHPTCASIFRPAPITDDAADRLHTCELWLRFGRVLHGKARNLGIAAHDGGKLFMRGDGIDVGKSVGCALGGEVDHALRSALAVERERSPRSWAGDRPRRRRAPLRVASRARKVGKATRVEHACEAPLDPTGYIGCAASPRSVTRPASTTAAGRGRTSDIRWPPARRVISAAGSRNGRRNCATCGMIASSVARRAQSCRPGGEGPASARRV